VLHRIGDTIRRSVGHTNVDKTIFIALLYGGCVYGIVYFLKCVIAPICEFDLELSSFM